MNFDHLQINSHQSFILIDFIFIEIRFNLGSYYLKMIGDVDKYHWKWLFSSNVMYLLYDNFDSRSYRSAHFLRIKENQNN